MKTGLCVLLLPLQSKLFFFVKNFMLRVLWRSFIQCLYKHLQFLFFWHPIVKQNTFLLWLYKLGCILLSAHFISVNCRELNWSSPTRNASWYKMEWKRNEFLYKMKWICALWICCVNCMLKPISCWHTF